MKGVTSTRLGSGDSFTQWIRKAQKKYPPARRASLGKVDIEGSETTKGFLIGFDDDIAQAF